MKKLFAAVALFLGLGFAANAQEGGSVVPSIDPNASEMKFEAEVLDFGTVKFDGNGVREFKIKVHVWRKYFILTQLTQESNINNNIQAGNKAT